jgi:hypothetical protein
MRALHHFERFRARHEEGAKLVLRATSWKLQVQPSEQSEADQAIEDQKDRNHQIE